MSSPPNSIWQALPDFLDLEQAPELGPVALLQAALVVARAALEASIGPALTLRDTLGAMPGCDASMLARLAADRCNELGELLTCYRIALTEGAANDDDRPF